MPHFLIKRPLSRFRGAVTKTLYTSTENAVITAPDGEFKRLRPSDYVILNDDGTPLAEPAEGEESTL